MKTIKYNLLSIAIFAVFSTAVSAGDVTGLNTFVSGTPAVAAEVNANFTAVKTAVDDNNTRINSNTTNATSNTNAIGVLQAQTLNLATGCPAGESIRAVAPDGVITCEVDTDTNTIYAAGTGLSLSGTTFNANTNYLQRRIIASCGTNASIKSIAADGMVTCETDDNSGGDITAVSAGSGLTGGGTSGNVTVSVGVGSITSSHITNGTITGNDIASSSVPSGDISNETGLEFSQKSGEGTLVNLIYSGYVIIEQISFTAPSSGYVNCIATGSVDRVDTTSAYSVSVGWDNDSGNAVDSFTYIRSVANGNYIIPYTSMHTFTVSAGYQFFYFKAKTSSPDNTDFDIRENSYACMFFPTRY